MRSVRRMREGGKEERGEGRVPADPRLRDSLQEIHRHQPRCHQVMVQQNKCSDNIPSNVWNMANNKRPMNPALEGPIRLSWELVAPAIG